MRIQNIVGFRFLLEERYKLIQFIKTGIYSIVAIAHDTYF